MRMVPVGAEVVCLIDVRPSPGPVYAKTHKGDNCFYVRVSNATQLLDGPDIQNYIEGHWHR